MPKHLVWSKDLKFEIRKKIPPSGHRYHEDQFEAIIKTGLPKLNFLCGDCAFCRIIKNKGRQASELGIQGFMSNAEDDAGGVEALKPTNRAPSKGIDLRKPLTRIIEKRDMYVCGNKKAGGVGGIYIVGPDVPTCEHQVKRPRPKKSE